MMHMLDEISLKNDRADEISQLLRIEVLQFLLLNDDFPWTPRRSFR